MKFPIRHVFLAQACISLLSCGFSDHPGAGDRIQFNLLSGGDTIAWGYLKNNIPDSLWRYRLAQGQMNKLGLYDDGLLTGSWTYELNGHPLKIEWKPMRESIKGLDFSIPADFLPDQSVGNGYRRFVRSDSTCSCMLEVHFDTLRPGYTFDEVIGRERQIELPGFTRTGEDCHVLELSTSSSSILDVRSYFVSAGGAGKEVRYTQRKIGDRSIWFRFEHSCDTDVQNMLYGEILQSLLFNGEYFYDPRGDLTSAKPCSGSTPAP